MKLNRREWRCGEVIFWGDEGLCRTAYVNTRGGLSHKDLVLLGSLYAVTKPPFGGYIRPISIHPFYLVTGAAKDENR